MYIKYNDFINSILNDRGRFNCGNNYHERHHVIPKCLGGKDKKENLIDLFPKEHFIAHKLLKEENPNNNKLNYAYAMMAFCSTEDQKRYELTPEEYEKTRKDFSNMLKARYSDKTKHPNYGKHLSEEHKRKISEANKGNKYCVGRMVSKETREKIGNANRNPSEETRKKMSIAHKGKQIGGDNPRAKKVIRLSDKYIYSCAKECAKQNDINYSTLKSWLNKKNIKKDFLYYEDYLKQESN